jgi:hypothetical protein
MAITEGCTETEALRAEAAAAGSVAPATSLRKLGQACSALEFPAANMSGTL